MTRRAGALLRVLASAMTGLALQACTSGSATVAGPCAGGRPLPMDAQAVQRYLDSTRTIAKTFYDDAQFERARGVTWQFAPTADVLLRQSWMSTPRSLKLRAMKVWQQSGTLVTLLLTDDRGVLRLEQGDVSLLRCG